MRRTSESSDRSSSSAGKQTVCGALVLIAFVATALTQIRVQLTGRDAILANNAPWTGRKASAVSSKRGTIWSEDGYALAPWVRVR